LASGSEIQTALAGTVARDGGASKRSARACRDDPDACPRGAGLSLGAADAPGPLARAAAEPAHRRDHWCLGELAYVDLARHGLPRPAEGAASRMARGGAALALDHGFMAMLEASRIWVVPEVVCHSDRDAHLVDGTFLRPQVIIAATGYRPALKPIVGHLGVLDAAGVPTRVRERDSPYFVGFRPTLAGPFATPSGRHGASRRGRSAGDSAPHVQRGIGRLSP
jgi:hypothetical protein